MIPLTECIMGHTYRLTSRNLAVGVFCGDGFVGIRQKFEERYLDTEYHYDKGPPFGTACPEEDLGDCPVPDIAEHFRETHESGIVLVPNVELFEYLEPLDEAEHVRYAAEFEAEFGA